MAAEYVDVLQIPAFLCRQTDLLVAAAQTGKIVNIKKGQFLSPGAMQFAVQKVADAGNDNVMITERGTTFGYTDLVVDYRGIPQMLSGHHGCNPLITTAQPDIRRNRRSAGIDRNNSQSRYCCRHRRSLHRNPSGTFQSEIRRSQYATIRFARRLINTFSPHP